MKNDGRKRIEKIIGKIQCPKRFKCVESGVENLCKAKDFGLEDYLECLEEIPPQCTFAFPFGTVYFCQCPLRVYLAKKLKK